MVVLSVGLTGVVPDLTEKPRTWLADLIRRCRAHSLSQQLSWPPDTNVGGWLALFRYSVTIDFETGVLPAARFHAFEA